MRLIGFAGFVTIVLVLAIPRLLSGTSRTWAALGVMLVICPLAWFQWRLAQRR